MSLRVVIIPPGEREDLQAAFRRARRNSVFGAWECCGAATEEKDRYDDGADYVLALDRDERIIFGLRVITKTPAMPLPIERYLLTDTQGNPRIARECRVLKSSTGCP